MRKLVAAIRFLTIIPVPGGYGAEAKDLDGSTWFFPVVGLLIGGAAAALALGLWAVFPPPVAAVLAALALAGASGGLHLDGLADTADGFLSSRPRERVLEIMKDSRTGAMGVGAIVFAALLKAAALGQFDGAMAWRAVLLAPVAGRCMMVVAMAVLPYARPEGGLGTAFCKSRAPMRAVWSLLVVGAAGGLTAGWAGLIAVGAALAVTLLFSAWSWRRIGGATGDTFGATCELAELAVVVALTAVQVAALIPGRAG